MKAISIQQPWAHLIVHGYIDGDLNISRKNIENRSWPSSYRGPLLIHASKGMDHLDACLRYRTDPKDLVFGACIGIVEMWDCIPRAKVRDILWAEGPWCHLYRNPRAFPNPIPWKGGLGLWDVSAELRNAIQALGSIDLAEFPEPTRKAVKHV